MAAAPTPDPTQAAGGAPAPDQGQGGAPGATPPSQAPAPPEMVAMSRVIMVLKQLSQQNPVLATGMQKAIQGINEAQSALVSQPQPQSNQSSPPY
jgi:hypothetical protein